MKRIVIVDDDRMVRTTTGLFFESAGWEVSLAADAAQARALIAGPFDAMVCDLNLSRHLPGDGLEVLAAARAANPAAVRILLSGEGSSRASEVAPDAIVQKPVRLPVLEKMVADLCRERAGGGAADAQTPRNGA
jgi:DNA-binding response OmpR family regulator